MSGIQDCKTILLIGGTSGIGQALAYALLDLPSKPTVIVGGRRQQRLNEMKRERLETVQVDINSDAPKLKTFVDSTLSKFPDIDAVILCAGIQRVADYTKPDSINVQDIADEMNINYIAPVTLIKYFMPHFLKLSESGRLSYIIPVTSGLAICPMTAVANYCASKAALHHFSTALSVQLSRTHVKVMEIIPPLVESELHDHDGTTAMLSKMWMPLKEFTEKEIDGLKSGQLHIPIGTAAEGYEQFNERGKIELVKVMHERIVHLQQ